MRIDCERGTSWQGTFLAKCRCIADKRRKMTNLVSKWFLWEIHLKKFLFCLNPPKHHVLVSGWLKQRLKLIQYSGLIGYKHCRLSTLINCSAAPINLDTHIHDNPPETQKYLTAFIVCVCVWARVKIITPWTCAMTIPTPFTTESTDESWHGMKSILKFIGASQARLIVSILNESGCGISWACFPCHF